MSELAEKNDTLDPTAVAEFLIENPSFLVNRPDLLEHINLKHLQSGGAVSLIEKQVALFREKNQDLESKLNELINIARQNEQLSNQLHSFASNLLDTYSVSDVLATTEDIMRDVFKIDFVAMRMLNDVTDDMLLVIDEQTESDLFAEFFTLNEPICGQLSTEYIQYFFADHYEQISSAAMVPLKSVQHLGVLTLGSTDPQHFSEDKGLLFLTHIGDLISSALVAHLRR